ncbi:hypothetical protein L211DRAFT_852788 [Terfezia boudieri ATCC MYA-4762]|uniref:Uncharacterized protein n=1 Tax=Terfezia boudieri ATCC MYA-4762 TaxID=1051890 RepID=A0A3N4LAJ2_9PEZI|nr:hypothetical protein L211DRAFT_852788 [Terfezia boudieri ATCC MYA-4762]
MTTETAKHPPDNQTTSPPVFLVSWILSSLFSPNLAYSTSAATLMSTESVGSALPQSVYDLRTRTLTCILSAIRDVEASSRIITAATGALKPNPVAIPHDKHLNADLRQSHSLNTDDLSAHYDTRWLKLLNQVALLLVRENEIVAVLPKRSGPRADLSIMIMTDSDTDSDVDTDSDISEDDHSNNVNPLLCAKIQDDFGYFITRNPRRNSIPTPQHLLEALGEVDNLAGMLTYLSTYRYVSFTSHISSIEYLINKIILTHPSKRDDSVNLLRRYITFRAAPKMHRRFSKSPAFRSIIEALHKIDPRKIPIGGPEILQLTEDTEDYDLVGTILFHVSFPKNKCPSLWHIYNYEDAVLVYDATTAGEFHQMLLFCLERAQGAIANLTKAVKEEGNRQLEEAVMVEAEHWMTLLHIIVHESKVFQVHVQALEGLIAPFVKSNASAGGGIRPPAIIDGIVGDCNLGHQSDGHPQHYQRGVNIPLPDTSATILGDLHDIDADGGFSDTAIEITASQQVSRAVQQSLCLAVSYEQAILSITSRHALPETPISLTLWEPPYNSTIEQSKQMADWTEVIRSMYTSDGNAFANLDGARARNISVEEAIDALKDYGIRNGGRSAVLFKPSMEGSICSFRGCYHAESLIGTIAYGQMNANHPTTAGIPQSVLEGFKNTYRTIGVSKRCCPVCTKLLSLLSTCPDSDATPTPLDALGSVRHRSTEPLTVLLAHHNIYPTALPPSVPTKVASELVVWLEGLVKQIVDEMVRNRRASVQTCRTEDSKGVSSGKKTKRKKKSGRLGQVRKEGCMGGDGRTRFVEWGAVIEGDYTGPTVPMENSTGEKNKII